MAMRYRWNRCASAARFRSPSCSQASEIYARWGLGSRKPARASRVLSDTGSRIGRTAMRLPFIATAFALGTIGLMGPSAGQDRPTAAQEISTSVVVLGSRQAESILGKEIRSKTDESMGRL